MTDTQPKPEITMVSRTAKGVGLFINGEPVIVAADNLSLQQLAQDELNDADVRPVEIKWGPRRD